MNLVLYPDEILTKVCEPVTAFDSTLHATLDEMAKVMVEHQGMGLAANQVGISKRFFIMKDLKGKIWEFINPTILEKKGARNEAEGCLSTPGIFLKVPRYSEVFVEAQDRNGETFRVLALDIEAVCVQHENDHLNGVFYLEKTSRNERRAAIKKLGLKK